MDTPARTVAAPRAGDWVEIAGIPGAPGRRGQVVEVLGAHGHEHYRIRWDEQHESLHYPADGSLHVMHHAKRRRAR
jgi:uncharacterized protein DUF1918